MTIEQPFLRLFEDWQAAAADEDIARQESDAAGRAFRRALPTPPEDLFHRLSDDELFSWHHHGVPSLWEGPGGARRLWFGDGKSQALLEGRRTILEEQDDDPPDRTRTLARIGVLREAYREWSIASEDAENGVALPSARGRHEAARLRCAALRKKVAVYPAKTLADAVLKARVVTWGYCSGSDEMRDQLIARMCHEELGPSPETLALMLACDLDGIALPPTRATLLMQELKAAEDALSKSVQALGF